MAYLKINKEKITDESARALVKICPFSAISYDGELKINSACKMCKLCVKNSKNGEIEYIEEPPKNTVDKSAWRGITVFADVAGGKIHPVTFELLGKAKELASVTKHPVYAVLFCSINNGFDKTLLEYGADKVFLYESPMFEKFTVTTYTNAFEDFINNVKPSAVLVGATNIGRSLAPRIACRFKTGLTADCTQLEMKENTDLVQIRPAFGGNIMARILTPNTRPQFCTVRYKVFSAPQKTDNITGETVKCTVNPAWEDKRVNVKTVEQKPTVTDISEADIIVAVGRGAKTPEEVKRIGEFADKIGAVLASTRPLVENGMMPPTRQIGLSGKTVAPKLIITLGISGAVQFAAGMKGAETIIAVNTDENAPIFDIAHYCVVGDMYSVLYELEQLIKGGKANV